MNKEWHVIAKQLSALQTDIDAERAAVVVASAKIVQIVTEDDVARERSHKKDSRRDLAESSRKDAPAGAGGEQRGDFARPIAMEGAHTAAMGFQDCASSVEFARPIAMEGAHTAAMDIHGFVCRKTARSWLPKGRKRGDFCAERACGD